MIDELRLWVAYRILLPLLPYILIFLLVALHPVENGWQSFWSMFTSVEILFLGVVTGAFGLRDLRKIKDVIGKTLMTVTSKVVLWSTLVISLFFHWTYLMLPVFGQELERNFPIALMLTGGIIITSVYVHLYRIDKIEMR